MPPTRKFVEQLKLKFGSIISNYYIVRVKTVETLPRGKPETPIQLARFVIFSKDPVDFPERKVFGISIIAGSRSLVAVATIDYMPTGEYRVHVDTWGKQYHNEMKELLPAFIQYVKETYPRSKFFLEMYHHEKVIKAEHKGQLAFSEYDNLFDV